ncbi:hypothetical protein TomTYG75_09150 [Sphingobium sp. TomTYG75]
MPQARISAERPGGALHLETGADGIAAFYPGYDRAESRTRISIASDAGTVSRTVQWRERGGQTVTLTVPGQARSVKALDLVLVVDTTGSMGDEMAYLQAELGSIVTRLKRDAGNLDVRIGLVVYRDRGDDYVTRSFPLSADVGRLQSMLDRQEADGRYIFLTDDSGIGDGHAEPDVACYVVTRLDQLIARVLAGIVEGHRVEPRQGEIIRTVGNYDRGRCGTQQIAAR